MHQEVSVIGKYPLGIPIALYADRELPEPFQLQADLVADRLDLTLIRPRANDEEVGKCGDVAEVENSYIESLLGLRSAYRFDP